MKNLPIWRPILIIAVILLGTLVVSSLELKRGIDLQGGVRMVYQVEVPPGQDGQAAVEQIIGVLSERVDPQGVMNLIWQPLSNNRFQITMPLATQEARDKREKWIEARDRLLQDNLDPQVAVEAVEAPDREAKFKELAQGSPRLQGVLNELADAWDQWQQAQEKLVEADKAYQAAMNAVELLPEDAAEEIIQKAEEKREQARRARLQALDANFEAKSRFESARTQLEEGNLSLSQLQTAFSRSDELVRDRDGNPISNKTPRQQALEDLKIAYPRLAQTKVKTEDGREVDLFEDALEKWEAYEAVRGPVDDPADVQRLIRRNGVLEFFIVPRTGEVQDIGRLREKLDKDGPQSTGDENYIWRAVDDLRQFAPDDERLEILYPNTPIAQAKSDWVREISTRQPNESLEDYKERVAAFFANTRGTIAWPREGDIYILLSNIEGNRLTRADGDWQVASAQQGQDQRGFPSIDLSLDGQGGRLMYTLTSNNVDNLMATVLDGEITSIATLQGQFSNRFTMTKGDGGYDPEEVRYLLRIFGSGSLTGKVSPEPISITKIAPSDGQENLNKGLTSAMAAIIVVVVFMMVYYFLNGVIANFALALNILLILATMALLRATFTLPGIAGVVLTVGMAVDANVLIFERLREELKRGSDMRTAVRNGYGKAFSTIIDANITTLITCVVLYYTATAEVKGFALTLMIGVLVSMFTALFCTRVVTDYYVKYFKPKTFHMLPTVIPAVDKLLSPNINWYALRPVLWIISGVLMVAGVMAIINRGEDLLDIEFRSGTQAIFTLREPNEGEKPEDVALTITEARDVLYKYADANGIEQLARGKASVTALGDPVGENERYRQFAIQAGMQDSDEMSNAVRNAFSQYLNTRGKVDFEGRLEAEVDMNDLARVPVFALRERSLGDNLRSISEQYTKGLTETDLARQVPAAFQGGLGVMLRDLQPAQTPQEIKDRIAAMAGRPPYNTLAPANVEVVPLIRAADSPDDKPTYSDVIVFYKNASVDYDTLSPEQVQAEFLRQDGFAVMHWQLTYNALQEESSLDSVTSFNPQVSGDMQWQAMQAMFLSLAAVVIYIWARFGSVRYGMAAIAALVHDVTIALGAIALTGPMYEIPLLREGLGLDPFRMDLAMIAAMLTIVGYSLNDTIVVFDRIRENKGRLAMPTRAIINRSINETVSRTVLTSFTTLLALITLYNFGGHGSVHGFGYAMIVGVVVGTYSSIGIAASLLGIKKDPEPETAPAIPER